jgi:TPR repeat protein
MDSSSSNSSLDPLWEKAEAAAEKGDNVGVIYLLKSLAEKGVWQALARIGELYETGGGNLERNLDEAVKWYRKSVFECDDPVAHLGLGRIYFEATADVEQDHEKAVHHFQKAYINRLPPAGIYLGIMFYFGIGTGKDKKKAREYFQFAADHEYFLAYGYLARMEFASGRVIRAIKLALKGWILMARLTKADPSDPRLLGVKRF